MGKLNVARGQQRGAQAASRVLYGPMASGKTRNGYAIAAKLGLQHVRDLDDVQLSGDRLQRHGYLYLANSHDYAKRAADLLGTDLMSIKQGLALVGARRQGVANA